jgi:tRNA A58 N-methylase Trm61
MINKDEVLKNLPDKSDNSWTTSLKFKEDLIDFIGDKFLDKTVLEIGTYQGHSTRLLSFLFKKVITVDNNLDFIKKANELNKDRNNIEYLSGDVYDFRSLDSIGENVDVVFIDAVHKYMYVLMDTIQSLERFGNIHLIYDDYGMKTQVKKAIDDCLSLGIIELVTHIGHEKGLDIKKDGKNETLGDREGIICKRRNYG